MYRDHTPYESKYDDEPDDDEPDDDEPDDEEDTDIHTDDREIPYPPEYPF